MRNSIPVDCSEDQGAFRRTAPLWWQSDAGLPGHELSSLAGKTVVLKFLMENGLLHTLAVKPIVPRVPLRVEIPADANPGQKFSFHWTDAHDGVNRRMVITIPDPIPSHGILTVDLPLPPVAAKAPGGHEISGALKTIEKRWKDGALTFRRCGGCDHSDVRRLPLPRVDFVQELLLQGYSPLAAQLAVHASGAKEDFQIAQLWAQEHARAKEFITQPTDGLR